MKISKIKTSQSPEIAKLAVLLTSEIVERTGIKYFDVDVPLAIKLCEDYIEAGYYTVLAAHDNDRIIGFAALCESRSLYAEGTFGIIQEFYVLPEYRSRQIGKQLIDVAVVFAKQHNWKRLELCTPPLPEFDRTVSFYQANGFEITSGYKMKRVIV